MEQTQVVQHPPLQGVKVRGSLQTTDGLEERESGRRWGWSQIMSEGGKVRILLCFPSINNS